jgi:AcrR family transcriptional regulator
MTISSGSPRGRETRERLLAAATEGFASRGYHGTTTAWLAERAGIAEGTIYRHVVAKEALYGMVCRRVWERGVELVSTDPATGHGARDRLAAIGHRLVEEAQRDGGGIRLMLRPPESPLDEPAARAHRRFRELLVQIVAAGKQEGTIRAGSADLWASLWLAVVAVACERVATGDWSPDHPNVGLTLEAAWDAIERGGLAIPAPRGPEGQGAGSAPA